MTAIVIGATAAQYYAKLFGVAPYAAFGLAADLVEGTDFAVGADLMGGTALTRTGTPTDNGYYAAVSDGNYWKTPFTATTLVNAASSQNGCTIMAVARKASGASFHAATSYGGSLGVSAPNVTLELGTATLVRGQIQSNSRIASIANDASRGSRFACYATVIGPTSIRAFEQHAGGGLQDSAETTFASQTIGGGDIVIGQRTDVSADTGDISAILFWKERLTPAEIAVAFDGLDRWLTPLGAGLC